MRVHGSMMRAHGSRVLAHLGLTRAAALATTVAL